MTYKISTAQMTILGLVLAASLGYFGIVRAQTATTADATSSPATDTETEDDSATTTASPTATTPDSTTTTATDTAASGEVLGASTSESPSVAIAAISAAEVASLEDNYHRQNAVYLQVLEGNHLPDYESGSVAQMFGKYIPNNMRIDIYEAAQGDGYQIFYEENGVLHSLGAGPEAADRTFTREPAAVLATSTPSQ
jgi:hypothetical protein